MYAKYPRDLLFNYVLELSSVPKILTKGEGKKKYLCLRSSNVGMIRKGSAGGMGKRTDSLYVSIGKRNEKKEGTGEEEGDGAAGDGKMGK